MFFKKEIKQFQLPFRFGLLALAAIWLLQPFHAWATGGPAPQSQEPQWVQTLRAAHPTIPPEDLGILKSAVGLMEVGGYSPKNQATYINNTPGLAALWKEYFGEPGEAIVVTPNSSIEAEIRKLSSGDPYISATSIIDFFSNCVNFGPEHQEELNRLLAGKTNVLLQVDRFEHKRLLRLVPLIPNNIEELTFWDLKITEPFVRALTNRFPEFQQLNLFSLSKVSSVDESMQTLLGELSSLTKLSKVVLNNINLTQNLVSSLRLPPNLELFSAKKNNLSVEALLELFPKLDPQTLKIFILEQNPIGDAGVTAFTDILVHLANLQEFYFTNTGATKETLQRFQDQILKSAPSVTQLTFGYGRRFVVENRNGEKCFISWPKF